MYKIKTFEKVPTNGEGHTFWLIWSGQNGDFGWTIEKNATIFDTFEDVRKAFNVVLMHAISYNWIHSYKVEMIYVPKDK